MLNLIPFIILMILNYTIYRTIKRKTFPNFVSPSQSKKEIYIATILITIVTIFGACHTLKCFINTLELVAVLSGNLVHILIFPVIFFCLESNIEQTWGPNMNIVVSLSHLLITINCSANFAIYCYKVQLAWI